jgi:hypothetical protein
MGTSPFTLYAFSRLFDGQISMDGCKSDYIFATRTLYHTMGKNAIFLCALAAIFSQKL